MYTNLKIIILKNQPIPSKKTSVLFQTELN
jgi:hypothetical protein